MGIQEGFEAEDEILVAVGISEHAFLQVLSKSRRYTDQRVGLVSLEWRHRLCSFKQDS